jgi:hypothetical protein
MRHAEAASKAGRAVLDIEECGEIKPPGRLAASALCQFARVIDVSETVCQVAAWNLSLGSTSFDLAIGCREM